MFSEIYPRAVKFLSRVFYVVPLGAVHYAAQKKPLIYYFAQHIDKAILPVYYIQE